MTLQDRQELIEGCEHLQQHSRLISYGLPASVLHRRSWEVLPEPECFVRRSGRNQLAIR